MNNVALHIKKNTNNASHLYTQIQNKHKKKKTGKKERQKNCWLCSPQALGIWAGSHPWGLSRLGPQVGLSWG